MTEILALLFVSQARCWVRTFSANPRFSGSRRVQQPLLARCALNAPEKFVRQCIRVRRRKSSSTTQTAISLHGCSTGGEAYSSREASRLSLQTTVLRFKPGDFFEGNFYGFSIKMNDSSWQVLDRVQYPPTLLNRN